MRFSVGTTVSDADYTTWADRIGQSLADPPSFTGITGQVWRDDDGDGKWDEGEVPVEGAGIYADLNKDGQWTPGEPRTVTDEEGSWQLADLLPGEYSVRMIPGGMVVPVDADASSTFSPPRTRRGG